MKFINIQALVGNKPREGTLADLLDALMGEEEVIFISKLNDVSPNSIIKYEAAFFELSRAYYHPPALEQAKIYLDELKETGYFEEGLNLQHYQASRLHIQKLEGQDSGMIASKALEALRITYPTFSPTAYKGEFLIAAEPQLLHIYASAVQSINLMQALVLSIEQAPKTK